MKKERTVPWSSWEGRSQSFRACNNQLSPNWPQSPVATTIITIVACSWKVRKKLSLFFYIVFRLLVLPQPQDFQCFAPRIHSGDCNTNPIRILKRRRTCLNCISNLTTLKGRSLEESLNELPVKETVIHGQDMELGLCIHCHGLPPDLLHFRLERELQKWLDFLLCFLATLGQPAKWGGNIN